MNQPSFSTPTISVILGLTVFTASAFDDFNVQMSKIAHEETSWRHDIYTQADTAGLWKSDWAWLQKPALTYRYSITQERRSPPAITTASGFTTPLGPDSEMQSSGLSGSFETWGGVALGFSYAHTHQDSSFRVVTPGGGIATVQGEDTLDSFGAYVAKQWTNGLKANAIWSHTRTDGERYVMPAFDTSGVSGGMGYARSFGEKRIGRNVFVDTSANFLYQSGEESWHFLWQAKAGHSLCPRFAIYGLFNLFHRLEEGDGTRIPTGPAGYHPIGDETWGETGVGWQGQLWFGASLTGEITVPILDQGITAENAFQVRAAMNWSF